MATIWDVLGIEPTTNEGEIRRAYARELKHRRPDRDPQGFQELREAFDGAKRYASSAEILPDEEAISTQEPQPTSMVEYVQQLMQEPTALSKAGWSREVLWHKAQELSTLLIQDELEGLGELHRYLDNDIPDSLEARQAFSQMLAEALSEQRWLYRSLLNEVSAVMHWQLDSYFSSYLPESVICALEQQITNTEQENYWQQLAIVYANNRYGQFKWRLLAEKGTAVPWWGRLAPDLLRQLAQQVNEIRQRYPALQERLNPLLLDALNKSERALSWEAVIAIVFWGYTAWLPGQESPKLALQSGLMLVVVAIFLWGYPILIRRFQTDGIAKSCVHSAFWLASMLILLTVFYRGWQGASAWQGSDMITMRILVIVLFLILPVGWVLWQRRTEWKTLPVQIVIFFMMFPVLLIRQLPPMVNLLGLMLLPMLYGFFIEMVYFVK
ncbi:molecular chaperone DnaJ [Erwinia sp. S43]|uniref:molecular chaperone DnaJ n=1 Tax=Erwinia sp. S43 TaxID=2769339 RepID=UPI001909F612|nr:molecular chaperone DnaJ [Erwinia sp. S43]MBK0035449.1 molecular chaperone DnaJ [Erwinia sp. S43]